jgi:serine/threonine protein kinase
MGEWFVGSSMAGSRQQPNGGSLPAHAQVLADEIGGRRTRRALHDLCKLPPEDFEELNTTRDAVLKELAAGLEGWPDGSVATIVGAVHQKVERRESFTRVDLSGWIDAQDVDPQSARRTDFSRACQSVCDCLGVDPPDEIRKITSALPRTGSQKIVFLAEWGPMAQEIVLKHFRSEFDQSIKELMQRELLPHPLRFSHPNIIATFPAVNSRNEPFLLEPKLPIVLRDKFPAGGVDFAANLLADIARALAFLHNELGLIHGDVKPDNVGYHEGHFLLLDFGVARPKETWSPEMTATGSLRTRAPELLGESRAITPELIERVDVWALGATVFNACTGRFPLFRKNESPPRVSNETKRRTFEEELARRVRDEWPRRVRRGLAHGVAYEPLREILRKTLEKDPAERYSAQELVDACNEALTSSLRWQQRGGEHSPRDLRKQFKDQVFPNGESSERAIERLSKRKRAEVYEALLRLEAAEKRSSPAPDDRATADLANWIKALRSSLGLD